MSAMSDVDADLQLVGNPYKYDTEKKELLAEIARLKRVLRGIIDADTKYYQMQRGAVLKHPGPYALAASIALGYPTD